MIREGGAFTIVSWCGLSSPAGIEFEDILRLRREAWQYGTNAVPPSIAFDTPDPHDQHAQHFAALDSEGVLIASARVCIHEQWSDVPDCDIFPAGVVPPGIAFPLASINRLVVDARYRGWGLSGELDRLRIEFANAFGAKAVIACVSAERFGRIAWLKRLGMDAVLRFDAKFVTRTHTHTHTHAAARASCSLMESVMMLLPITHAR